MYGYLLVFNQKEEKRLKERLLTMFLCISIVLGNVTVPISADTLGRGTEVFTVSELKVQNLSNPIGIDTVNPSLSWSLNSSGKNQSQNAYRIVVSSSKEKLDQGIYDMWDSQQVNSTSNYGITYEGTELESRQRVYWKVKSWDSEGNEAEWSEEPAYWEAGLLNASDWKAEWITRGNDSVIDKLFGLETNQNNYNVISDKFSTQSGRYLRISVTESGPPALGEYNDLGSSSYRMQIMELELYYNGQKITLAANAAVTASNTFNWGSMWGKDYLIDGNYNCGYTSNLSSSAKHTTPIEIIVDLGKVVDFDEVRLYCRKDTDSTVTGICPNYPKAYKYQVSNNNTAYTNIQEVVIEGERIPKIVQESEYKDYAPILSKEFNVDNTKIIESARLYISGLGLYEAHINGKTIGEGTYFNPGESDVRDTVYYVTYDITDMINNNITDGYKNAVSFMLGNGQYTNYRIHKQSRRYYKTDDWRSEAEAEGMFGEVKGMAQVVVTYDDGTTDIVGTDDTWSFVESPITENSWYGGEDYDATLEINGWDDINPEIDRNSWGTAEIVTTNIPKGSLKAREFKPIVIDENETIESEKITVTKISATAETTTYLVDMGRNGAGFPEISINTDISNLKILMYPAEVKTFDGYQRHINQESCTQSDSANGNLIYDTYITKGIGEETYHPRFAYHGYRYLEVVTPSQIILTNENFKGYMLRTDNEKTGSFSSSDSALNLINILTERSIESNMYSTFTDCPQIEKLGWLETPQLMFYSMSQTYDISSWIPKLLKDMVDSQYNNGKIAAIAPEYYRIDPLDTDINWNGSIIFTAWQYYEVYGDKNVFTNEAYNAMKKYISYLEKDVASGYLIHNSEMGDWGEMTSYGTTPKIVVQSSAYYRIAVTMSRIADVLGKSEDMSYYRKLAENIKTAFHKNKTCYNETYLYGNGTQSSYGCVIFSGIALDENVDKAVDKLVNVIKKCDYHLTSGEVGLKQVFSALATHGRSDVIFKMVMNDTQPSYKYFVNKGLTTLPEYWNFEDKWGTVTRSLNHAMMGHVKEWFTRYLAGINPVETGYDAIEIKPAAVGGLTEVNGTVDTVHGNIISNWDYDEDKTEFKLEVTIPVGITATVYIPKLEGGQSNIVYKDRQQVLATPDNTGKYLIINETVGSGSYTFTVKGTIPPDESDYMTVTYKAGTGGKISGSTTQRIVKGNTAKSVTAVANSGYKFSQWSDGVKTAARTDKNITKELTVTAQFTKIPIKVKKVTLNKNKITLGVKETFQLKAAISPTNAANKSVKWSSSNPSKVKVSQKGKITAEKKGKATITVKTSNGKTAKCKVTVKKAPAKITLKFNKKVLKKGRTFQIKVKLPSGSASNKISYKSSKKTVAKVSTSGIITAKKRGKATITVKTFNGKKAYMSVVVK